MHLSGLVDIYIVQDKAVDMPDLLVVNGILTCSLKFKQHTKTKHAFVFSFSFVVFQKSNNVNIMS